MSPIRTLLLVSAAFLVGACSDTQSTTGPSEQGPDFREQAVVKALSGFWTDAKANPPDGFETMHSPLLCNFGGLGPECLRVFHTGTYIDHVYHRGRAQGTGCSRSVIRIAGIVRGRSPLFCHVRGSLLQFTWIVREFHPFGTRIQVDWSGAGSASPTGFVFTNYR
jgi:hypothetical protein